MYKKILSLLIVLTIFISCQEDPCFRIENNDFTVSHGITWGYLTDTKEYPAVVSLSFMQTRQKETSLNSGEYINEYRVRSFCRTSD